MTIILGIDPGTNKTGYGIINYDKNEPKYIHHEVPLDLRQEEQKLILSYLRLFL